jgi:membrane fusion protein
MTAEASAAAENGQHGSPARAGPSTRATETSLALFRSAALSARGNTWLGTTRAVQPWPLKVVAPICAAVAVALAVFLTCGEYTQRTRVQGVLAPSAGLIKLSAPQDAGVLTLKVTEGDRVEKGQPLYVLDLDKRIEAGGLSEAVLAALRSQRRELQDELLRRAAYDGDRQSALRTKLSDTAKESGQVDRQIEVSKDYVQTLSDELDTYKDYLERGITIQRDILDRRSRLMTEKTQLELLRRDRVKLDAQQHATEAEITQIDQEGASKLSEIRRQIADLDRSMAEAETQRRIEIRAPEAGRVTGVVARAGQSVAKGGPLLTIVPEDGALQVNLYAQSSAIGFVREGAPVMLRYAAYPYQKFGQHPGVVTAISRAALRPDEVDVGVPLPPEAGQRGTLYRLTVRPQEAAISAYGKLEPLQVGMQVEADIFLDARPLWQWILNPLFSLRSLHGAPQVSK